MYTNGSCTLYTIMPACQHARIDVVSEREMVCLYSLHVTEVYV